MLATPDPFETDESRWEAVQGRDQAADGHFLVCVRTTGIVCRPVCPARTPLRKNVLFVSTLAEAREAGFRPCLRCRPDGLALRQDHAALVEAACRAIEQAETPPSLAALARGAGLSPFHFHRVFKSVTGVTPKAYADAHRAGRLRTALANETTVTDAVYGAGFSAPSRFYAAADTQLGMAPGTWRRGGAGATIRFAIGACSLGAVLVAATARGLCAIELGDDPDVLLRALQDRFPSATLIGGDPAFEQTVGTVIAFLDQTAPSLDLPLDIAGTAFQRRVWQALRAIPAGRRVTYAELAASVGEPAAVRAVASACGANPLAVAIPCHRVVRKDGRLGGYRWGIARKDALLTREAAGGEFRSKHREDVAARSA